MNFLTRWKDRLAAVRSRIDLRHLAALALAMPFAAACTGTTTIKLPAGTGVTHDWDTGRLPEVWNLLEELIQLNLEYLDPSTLIQNRSAHQLAIDNIEQLSALKRKVEHRMGQPVVGPS